MAKTVVGLFDSFDDAQQVVRELVDRGFGRDDISLVANDAKGQYQDMTSSAGTASDTEAAEGAGAGAVGGTVLGGTLGLLVGLGALAIPGIGPVIAAGPLAAAVGTTAAAAGTAALGAGIGAATGGLVGGLVGAGIPDEDAHLYAEGVRRGGTLVTVRADDTLANDAVDVMNRYGAVDIDDRGEAYRGEGWSNFNNDAEPYSGQYTSDYYTRDRGNVVTGAAGATANAADATGDNWRESSKAGTAGGTLAGAASGAAIGAAGGPVGAVIGGVAGAATGGGIGAAGDAAGEATKDAATGEDDASRRGIAMDSSSGLSGADLGFNTDKNATPVGDYDAVSGTTTGATLGGTSSDMGADTTITTGSTTSGGMRGDFDPDYYRNDYDTNYASSGYTYDQYEPAYRYGYDLSADERYRGRNWSDIEGDVGRSWDTDRYGPWDRFKDAVRRGWENTVGTTTDTTTVSDTGTTGGRRDYNIAATTSTTRNVEGETVLPVIEEQLQVGKRQVQRGGARIHTYVTETPVEEQVTLRDETVRVERRPVDRPLSDADMAAFQEGSIEITETDEEAVVAKQARVVEEVVVNKSVEQRTETVRDTVRRTDVEVENLTSETSYTGSTTTGETSYTGSTTTGSTTTGETSYTGSPTMDDTTYTSSTGTMGTTGGTGFDAYDNDFRSYYDTNYANSGYTYDQYNPVFRYGYQLGGDKRYQGEWTSVEPEARRYWEERNPGTWERFKDSVRYAWEKARGRA